MYCMCGMICVWLRKDWVLVGNAESPYDIKHHLQAQEGI